MFLTYDENGEYIIQCSEQGWKRFAKLTCDYIEHIFPGYIEQNIPKSDRHSNKE